MQEKTIEKYLKHFGGITLVGDFKAEGSEPYLLKFLYG